MRSYAQFCGLARTLDVIGDRWTMLILRELAIRPCRYTDIRDGIPGIATNLLADRLRHLETHGVITRTDAAPPIATPIYELTDHGRELTPILIDLARWGTEFVAQGQGRDDFRGRWLVLATAALYRGVGTSGVAPLVIALRANGERVVLNVSADGIDTALDYLSVADVTIDANPELIIGILSGAKTLAAGRAAGAQIHGSRADLARVATLTAGRVKGRPR